MKDSEFIELLNLYLDHEISAADAARLEAEVQSSAERRRIYEDYCRMQKACRQLAAKFATEAEAAAAPADRKIVAFNVAAAEAAAKRRSRAGNYYLSGAVAAAAACVAVVMIGQDRVSGAGNVPVTPAAPAVAAGLPAEGARGGIRIAANPGGQVPAWSLAEPASGASRMPGASALAASQALVVESLTLSGRAQNEALLVSAIEHSRAQFAWIESLQLNPVRPPEPLKELRFDTKPVPLRAEARTLGSQTTDTVNVEMAAFQFRR